FIEAGQWWRAITTTWLHGSWLHVILNALNTLVIVPFAVALVGKRLALLAWVVSAVGGMLGSVYAGVPLSVGASGAIMGIVGLVLAVLARKPPEVPEVIRRHYFRTLLFLTGIIFFYGYSVDGIVDNGGHLGGLVAGALLGAVLPMAGLRKAPIPTGWLLAAVAAFVALVIGTILGIVSAAQGGYLPDPVPHQQVPYGSQQLAVPAWWVDDQADGWDCRQTGLQMDARMLGPENAGVSIDLIARRFLEVDGFPEERVSLRRPAQTLEESGVERLMLDLDDGAVRWVVWVARRGDRTGVVRVVAPRHSYELYAAYLDEMAARATPAE
ncbi:MAG: rhomboid family intramembrane serine protease, partial [Planctomycetota bacterium]